MALTSSSPLNSIVPSIALCGLLLLAGTIGTPLNAHAASTSTVKSPPGQLTQVELEVLVQPIALYPDILLQQLLAASTFPEQILDAAMYNDQGRPPEGIKDQPWDEAVKAVANYPSILRFMASDLDWTLSVGSAFINQNEALRKAIQTMRAKAKTVGNLRDSEQQHVIEEPSLNGTTIIRIEPAEPEVVYVPATTTSVVYQEPVESSSNFWAPVATFGLGMALGYAINDDDDDHYYYGGGYYGPGFWHSNEAAERWIDYRKDRWDDVYDFANDRQEWRQDNREDWREYRQDLGEKQQEWRNEVRNRGNRLSPEQRAQAQSRASQARANRGTTSGSPTSNTISASSQVNRTQSGASRGSFSRAGSANYGSIDRDQAQQRMNAARNNPQFQQRAQQFEGSRGSAQQRLNEARGNPQFQQRADQYHNSAQPRPRTEQARSHMGSSSSGWGGGSLSGLNSGSRSVNRFSTRGSSSISRSGGFSRGGGGRGRR